ncbi:MAG TPA: Cof-type HAD-IIB family hydrolase [Candidatus Limnocylindrales bacterium]|jgi:Cof subfamily protein (haloacid dehalogenase superfamily)
MEGRFPIRLIAMDLDGTLVGSDLVLRPRTVATFRAVIADGVQISIATGRMAKSARPFAEILGQTAPIIAYQGALIRAMWAAGEPMGKLLFHRPLSAAAAREALAWSTEHGLAAHVNHLERFVLPASDPRADDYSAFLGARAEIVPDLMGWIQKPVTKILAVADAPLPTVLLPEARAHFAGRAEVTVSHPEFLEFLAPRVSKGEAVRWLARRLGIPLEQTMAIGDQFNDLEMIEGVGHGVAMPSAPPEVQARARYLAPPVGEDGAAQVVEALVLPGRDGARNADLFRVPR